MAGAGSGSPGAKEGGGLWTAKMWAATQVNVRYGLVTPLVIDLPSGDGKGPTLSGVSNRMHLTGHPG